MKTDDDRSAPRHVCRANLELADSGLVMGTFGNLSAVDRAAGVFAIKPSGVPYEELTPEHMVAVSLETRRVVDGTLRPSSDTPTHLELYRAFSLRRRSCTRTPSSRRCSRRRSTADPLHGHDACGLFPRRRSGHAADARRRKWSATTRATPAW